MQLQHGSIVDDVFAGGIQVRLNGSEAVPPADSHHHTWVHLLVDEQALCGLMTEIVTAHLLEVLVARLLSCSFGSATDDGTDTGLFQINNGVSRCNVVFVLVALQIPLNVIGKVGIAWFARFRNQLDATYSQSRPSQHE